MTDRYQAAGLIGSDEVIRLPTEFEWQLAATEGKADRKYPWGPDWDPTAEPWRANTYESDLGRSTAVGLYPEGASPVGALDMAGNLWEWCLNPFEYEDPDDLALDNVNADRVLRGGSWFNDQEPLPRRVSRQGRPGRPSRRSSVFGCVCRLPSWMTDHSFTDHWYAVMLFTGGRVSGRAIFFGCFCGVHVAPVLCRSD